MEAFITVGFLAFLIERVIFVLKPLIDPLWKWENISPYPYLSLLLGWLVAGIYAADVILAAGAITEPTTPQMWLGAFLTGILLAGGSQVISEVTGWLQGTRREKVET